MSSTDLRPSRRSALQLGAVTVAGLGAGLDLVAGAAPAQAAPPARAMHLYTTDPEEARLATEAGYRAKGEPTWVFPESTYYRGNRTIRLHRLHHRDLGDRLCTISAAEAEFAVQHRGYTDESDLSPMWACAVTDPAQAPPGTTQLLRLWQPHTQDHLHTIDPAEADAALWRRGCRREPEYPAPYLLTAADPAAVRLYRLSRNGWI